MPCANHTHSQTKRHPARRASKSDPCGCPPPEEACCELDCLVQPRFFSGQLLTDTDLTELLRWSKNKFRLSRFRHGWGVVCGLEVQCDAGGEAVQVGPGYAVDCCGNDILVCEDTSFPLDDACFCPPDPCATPEKATPGSSAKDSKKISYFGCLVPEDEIRQKVLTLHYAEFLGEFQTTLGQGACGGEADCQASRTHEGFSLRWEDPDDQRLATLQAWRREYDACRDVLLRYQEWVQRQPDGWHKGSPQDKWGDIQRWLLKWIDGSNGLDAHPLHQFCWLRNCLCDVNPNEIQSPDLFVTEILFWLVQDCRNQFLHCECHTCPEDQGVPLARVCLWVPKKGKCKVLAIDPYPPHRRPLSLDCWPSLPGMVNVGEAIWQTPEQARDLLMSMGLAVNPDWGDFEIPRTVGNLYESLKCEPVVSRDEKLILQVYDTKGCLGKRVVGVCSAPADSYRPGGGKVPPAGQKGRA